VSMPPLVDTTDLFHSDLPAAEQSVQNLDHLLEGACHEDGRDLLEALIFSSPDPLSMDRLTELLEMPVTAIRELIATLNTEYAEHGRAFEIQSLAGGWQLVSRRRYAYLIRRLLKTRVKPRLSRAALESLSVIAYKQPVTKGEIESLRGVKADGVVRTLLERHLIMICGRSDAVGRPLLYRTTREFLETFGINSVDELPRLKEMKDLIAGRSDGALPHENLSERSPAQLQAAQGDENGSPSQTRTSDAETQALDETMPGEKKDLL
jgi:segregation and condensation protein B